jgi:dihydroorotase-like cyclic amidohydrolase
MTADLVLKNGWVVTPEETVRGGVAISNGKFVAIGTDESLPEGKAVIELAGKHILPGTGRGQEADRRNEVAV